MIRPHKPFLIRNIEFEGDLQQKKKDNDKTVRNIFDFAPSNLDDNLYALKTALKGRKGDEIYENKKTRYIRPMVLEERLFDNNPLFRSIAEGFECVFDIAPVHHRKAHQVMKFENDFKVIGSV